MYPTDEEIAKKLEQVGYDCSSVKELSCTIAGAGLLSGKKLCPLASKEITCEKNNLKIAFDKIILDNKLNAILGD
jgi:hypothetical protein